MTAISIQQLTDAARDADDLGLIVNAAADRPNPGQANGTVTTRLGRVIMTVAAVIAAIQFQEQTATAQAQAAAASAVQAGQYSVSAQTASAGAVTAAAQANAAQEALAGLQEAIQAAINQHPFAVAVDASNATFETLGVAKLAAIPAAVHVVVTRGRLNPGDGGQATWKRVTTDQGPYLGWRSADRFMPDGSTDNNNGGFWLIVPNAGTIYGPQVGAFGDYAGNAATATDNFLPVKAACEFRETGATGPRVVLGPGVHYSSQTLEYHATYLLESVGSLAQGSVSGFARTWIMTPTNVVCLRIIGPGQTGVSGTGGPLPGCSGSKIKGITFTQVTQGNDPTAHAIDVRAQVYLEDCTYVGIAGDGEHIEGYTDGGGRFGNANDWSSINCFAHSVKGWGHFCRGSDVNAGYSRMFQTQVCGLGGIYYHGYFTSKYVATQLAGYGSGGVFHNGACWQLISEGNGGAQEPGTNPSIW